VVIRASLVAGSAVIRIEEGIDLAAVRHVGIAVLKAFGARHNLAAATEALRVGVVEVTRGVALAAVVEVRRQGHFAAVLGALVAVRRARTAHELTRLRVLGTGDALTTRVRRRRAVGVVFAPLAYVTSWALATTVEPRLASILNVIVAAGFLANETYTFFAEAVGVDSASEHCLARRAFAATAVDVGLLAVGRVIVTRSISAFGVRALPILAIGANFARFADATRLAFTTAVLVGLGAIDDVVAAVCGPRGCSPDATSPGRR